MHHQLKTYYNAISDDDNKKSIAVESIIPKDIARGVNVIDCKNEHNETNMEIDNNKFTGKIIPPTRYNIMQESEFGKLSMNARGLSTIDIVLGRQ